MRKVAQSPGRRQSPNTDKREKERERKASWSQSEREKRQLMSLVGVMQLSLKAVALAFIRRRIRCPYYCHCRFWCVSYSACKRSRWGQFAGRGKANRNERERKNCPPLVRRKHFIAQFHRLNNTHSHVYGQVFWPACVTLLHVTISWMEINEGLKDISPAKNRPVHVSYWLPGVKDKWYKWPVWSSWLHH